MHKIMTFLVLAASLSACSVSQQLAKDCSGDLELGCKQIFGESNGDDLQAQLIANSQHDAVQDAAINELRARITTSVSNINSHDTLLGQINGQLASLYTAITTQGSTLATQAAEIGQLQATQSMLIVQITALQTQANNAAASIAELQLQDSVIEYIDPCGDNAGYDEVLMRTRTGKLVAYFESGTTRFLSLLSPGNYQTTDTAHCAFNVTSSGQVCDNMGCR